MPDLVEYFGQVFSLGLEVENRLLTEGRYPQPPQQVQQRIMEAMATARAAAQRDGKRPQDVDEAVFAVVAWVDEIIARFPNWSQGISPLQMRLFNTHNAGDEFFVHLRQLTPQQDEVREVYFTVLTLGFVGQYYFDAGEQGELARIKDAHARQLPHPPAAVHRLHEERITPQPYLVRDPGPPRLPRYWDRWLLWAGAAVAVLVPAVVLVRYLLQPPALPPPIPIPPPKQAVVIDSKAIDSKQVKQVLDRFKCSELSYSLGTDNTVVLKGHVPTEEEVEHLKQEVARVPGVDRVSADGVEVRIWPYCEVVEILFPYKQVNAEQGYGLHIEPSGQSEQFKEGEKLVLDLIAPSFDAYLYVDYYRLDGTVAHMLPSPIDTKNQRRADERFTIGLLEPDNLVAQLRGWEAWQIKRPFGREMIVVMAAPSPLFPKYRKEFEPAKQYLGALRQGIGGNRQDNRRFIADYFFIFTEAAQP